MMKNIIQITLLVLMVFFAGCKENEKITIGFLYPSETIVRFNKESVFFKQYCKKQGVDVEIRFSSNDEAVQIEQASELIDRGVDALVIIADNVNTAAVMVRNAHAEGIPVMAYNRMIKNSNVDFFVGSSNDLIGKIMVNAVLKEKPSGNFVVLGGDKFDKNGEELQEAILKYLQPKVDKKEVDIVYKTFIEKWDSEIAGFEMEKVLSLHGDDIDAVIVGFDGMADAAIQVLEKYNLAGKVAVTGQDAEIRGCKNIIAGKQVVTVFHPLQTIAEKGAEIAIAMAKGKDLKEYTNSSDNNGLIDVPTNRVNSIAITKDNIDEVLVKSGFYKKEELYN